jgi:hypothetical protein
VGIGADPIKRWLTVLKLTSTCGLAVNVIPEPAGWALMLAGLAGLPLLRARWTRG